MIRGEVTLESSRRTGHGVPRDQGRCAPWLLWLVLGGAVCLCLAPVPTVLAQMAKTAADKQLDKCRFLQSLGVYCTWPDEAYRAAPDRFVIALLGDEPNPKATEAFFNRIAPRVKNRKFVVQRIKSLDDLPACQILYLTDSVDQKTAQAAVELLRGKPVLVAASAPEFVESGGCAAFAEDKMGDVRLKLNAAEMRARKIGIDVRLSRMGVTVDTTTATQKPP